MRRPATKSNPVPATAATPALAPPRFPAWPLAVLLALLALALYWPVTHYDFVNYDDPRFVAANAQVQNGLTWEGVKWAFQLTQDQGDYWHPLVWLSWMLDVSLFGRAAGGFHLTNVALHAANSALLLLLLRLLTGAFWRSLVVAALFALHPLRVESVAWVAARKDVLSAFFGFLSLLFYVRYAKGGTQNTESRVQPDPTRNPQQPASPSPAILHPPSAILYLLSLFFLACGLMSKPMLVTWPFVMLLLDYWPLQRLTFASRHDSATPLLRLIREKVPLFVLSGVSCVITYWTERAMKASADLAGPPALLRLENAFVACARYLGKTLWPVNLALPYPHPGHWSALEVGGSVVLVVGLCGGVFWLARRWPCLLVGWCWFLGTLIPVIGLTRGWGNFMADRFTYLPSVGVLILLVWGAYELTRRWRYHAMTLAVGGAAAIVLCLVLTRQQIGCWTDGEALFRHALDVTEDNYLAHINLGTALDENGQTDEAIRQYQEALRLKPDLADPHINLGKVLAEKGQMDEAIRQFQEAIRLNPDYAEAHYNLGIALARQGQMDEAIRQYQGALRLKPDYALAHNNLGNALVKKGQVDDAIRHYQEAIRLKPDYALAHNNLAVALLKRGQMDEAIRQYQEVIHLKPGDADAHNNLGTAFGTKGQMDEAIRQYEEALRLKPGFAKAHNNLGNALLNQGQIDEAIREFQEALRLRPDYADARRNLDVVLATKAGSSQPPSASTRP